MADGDFKGLSVELAGRDVITHRTGFQGINIYLGDQQPFNFEMGFNAVLLEEPNKEEQWFQPQHGFNAVDIEFDNPTIGRGYIIKK
jgi:hypothetical protein